MSVKHVTFITAGALLILWFTLVNRTSEIEVEVVTPNYGQVESSVSNTRSGTIKACKRSKLAPSTGGQISALYVQEGDFVKSGDLLMELWNQNLIASVSRAEAALQAHRLKQHSICIAAASDEREAQRFAELAKKELAAKDIVDRATSKANASEATCLAAKSQEKEFEAQLQLQKALLEQTFIRAPFDGTVAKINGEVGEFATPSPPGVPTPPVIDLLTADCFYLTAPIDEVDAALLKVGQPARVTLDAFRGQQFDGRVRRVAPFVEDFAKQARTVDIEVIFDSREQPLLVGYSADVEVILASRDHVIRIPTEAIMEDNQIWIVDANNQLQKVAIETGIGNWKYTEVVSGLTTEHKVVTSLGMAGLEPGVKVSFKDGNQP